MQTVYHLQAHELNEQFLESLKLLFKDKTIEIVVTEVDETSYLLQSPANKEKLLQAVDNVEQGKNLVTVDLDAIE